MKVIAWALMLGLVLAAPAVVAAETVERTLNGPVDRVWDKTTAVLKVLGWDIDKDRTDRSVGIITTDSRRVEGENYGVYEKGLRHRLRLSVKAKGDSRTVVGIERSVFKRERILFVDKDEVVTVADRSVEKSLLDAIEKAL